MFLEKISSQIDAQKYLRELGVDGGERQAVLALAKEIAAGQHGEMDSLLLYHNGKLRFEVAHKGRK